MDTVRMTYTGRKNPYVLQLPVPFVSKHEKVGEIVFSPEADVPVEIAEALEKLLGADSPFLRVNGASPLPHPPVVESMPASPPVVPKKWPTKAECQAFIDANHINGKPRYFGRQTWIVNHAISA